MTIPWWALNMYDGFNASASPMIGYCSVKQWFWANFTSYDQRHMEDGAATSWQCIDKESVVKNTEPKSSMTLAAVNTCFSVGRLGINIPDTTPTGKRREISLLKWSYVMKYMPKKKRARKSWIAKY